MKPGFFRAMGYPFRGFAHLLGHRGLWKYGLAAFAVNVLVLTTLLVAFIALHGRIVDALTPETIPSWLRAVVGCLVTIVAVILALFLFTVLGNIVAGPFLDAMTEKMLASLGETLPPPRRFWPALGRSLVNQGLKLITFGLVQALLLLLLLTPVAFLHPVFAGFLTVFFLGLEYVDYPLDARGVSVPRRLGYAFSHLGPTLGFGAVAFVVMLVPFLGYFMLPVSVCGATLLVHDLGG